MNIYYKTNNKSNNLINNKAEHFNFYKKSLQTEESTMKYFTQGESAVTLKQDITDTKNILSKLKDIITLLMV